MYSFKPSDLRMDWQNWNKLLMQNRDYLEPADKLWLTRWEEVEMALINDDFERRERRYGHWLGYFQGLQDTLEKIS